MSEIICDNIAFKRKHHGKTQYFAHYNENWDWIDKKDIKNKKNLLKTCNYKSKTMSDFMVITQSVENNDHSKPILSNYKTINNDTLYILDSEDYHPEPLRFDQIQSENSIKIEKIIGMENNNGIIRWNVLFNGSDTPVTISHTELRSRNPELIVEYYFEKGIGDKNNKD